MSTPQKAAIGFQFQVTVKENEVAVNLSAATTKQLIFKKPGGDLLTKTASFYTNGSDGILTYTTIAGDLDEAGSWEVQANLVLGTYTGRTSRASFMVDDNL